MNSLRFIVAITLCLAILIGWNLIFQPRGLPPRPPPPAEGVRAPEVRAEPVPLREPPSGEEVEKEVPEKNLEISINGVQEGEGNRVHLKLSNVRGGIAQVVLPRFKARDGKEELILIPQGEGTVTLGLWAGVEKYDGRSQDLRNWDVEAPPGPDSSAAFTVKRGSLGIQKELKGSSGHYHLEVTLTLENRSDQKQKVHYRLRGPVGLESESLRGEGTDLRLLQGRRVSGGEVSIEGIPVGSITGEWVSPYENMVLIGSSNNYFASVLAADPETSAQLRSGFAKAVPSLEAARQRARKEYGRAWEDVPAAQRTEIESKVHRTLETGLVSREIPIDPGEKVTHRFILFLGPRDEKVLGQYPWLNLTQINDYGWWTVLVKLFLQILKGFHYVTGSWGLSIVCLTFLVRLCLHPINRRQQASMMRYQKKVSAIKPQLDQLKERYGSNRMRMNQEMQKLFKEQGINPTQMMGGCLMIFFQLPVWYALYSSIEYSLDLRRAPFLWIPDLTQPDRAIPLPFTIPLLGWTEINLLPVIYVILTILQQKMQPKPTDPQMQQQMKMMTFMMVFFGFIFYSFPAGFLLYFIASAAIGMVESKIIKRLLARQGLVVAPPGAPAPHLANVPNSPPALYPARSPQKPNRKKS